MRLSAVGLLATVACVPTVLCCATVGQIDTFQNGTTQGWFAGGLGLGMFPPVLPQVVATGGPRGAGDEYLQITSQGGGDVPGSRLAAQNLAQWAGNYLTSGISGIAMDLKNYGTTDLTIRLLFEDPQMAPPVDAAVTTFGAFVPVGSGWTHAFFPISPAGLTVLSGSANAVLSNTTLMRIIDSPTPTDAVPIAGVLGVDNINAVPEPSTLLLMISALAAAGARRLRRT